MSESNSTLRSVVLAGLVAVVGAMILAGAGAAAGPSSRKIPAHFVLLTTPTPDGRCLWGIGVEFPTVPGATSYTINYFDGLYRHWVAGGVASTAIAPNAAMPHGLNYYGITGGGGPQPCPGDVTEGGRFLKPVKAFANFPGKAPKTGAIQGTVSDKDGGGVPGVSIRAYGTIDGHPDHVSVASGPGGFYYATVPAGSWRVVPDLPSLKKATFKPASDSATVTAGATATANFTLDAGLQLQLSFDRPSVPDSGLDVVKGTIKTTEYGRPKGNVGVQLTVMPTSPGSALTTAPRATVCGPSGRVWPAGTLSAPTHGSVNVTTDATGTYDFTITVGTKPGTWSLDAWARNTDGTLSTDTSSASDTASMTFTPLKPTELLSNFVNEFNGFAGSSLVQAITTDPGVITSTLAQLTAAGALKGASLGGLAFAETNGTDGPAVLVYDADAPPEVSSSGAIAPGGANAKDLVLDPSEWAVGSLQTALQAGALPELPTLSQWASGATVKAWKLKPNSMTVSSQSFQWLGWAYPGITTPGACY